MNLPYGFTNATTASGGVVEKRYVGPAADARLAREAAVLDLLAPLLPVPAVLAVEPAARVIRLAAVDGRHGQRLVEHGHGREVLALLGGLLRRLQSLAPGPLLAALAARDGTAAADAGQDARSVLVHGDFGSQNLLVAPDRWSVAALLDWELAHAGRPIEDLAWAEWSVRTHHPEATDALPALFAGYGATPPWEARRTAMLEACRAQLVTAERAGAPGVIDTWHRRLADTAAWAA